MTYYKISEDDLFELIKDSYRLDLLKENGVDNWSYYGECFNNMMPDEEIYEMMNSCYEICK